MNTNYDALALFSGGLDSILAIKTLEEQGLKVKALHCVSPFFGKPDMVDHWQRLYHLDIDLLDIGDAFVEMLVQRPGYGFGKVMNPCVNCKILMLEQARRLMPRYGARFLISGEVLGQRPMSQRRDTLNVIRRDACVRDILLRPLSAKLLDPTPMEQAGLVDRESLYDIGGRGRQKQLALAKHFQLKAIPTPAGGCALTERENARCYWTVLCKAPHPTAAEFHLANAGRQYWAGDWWLAVGRNKNDNAALLRCAFPEDAIFHVLGYPAPLAVGRQFTDWPADILQDAAAFVTSFAPKAVRAGEPVGVRITRGSLEGALLWQGNIMPERTTPLAWATPSWPAVRENIRDEAKKKMGTQG